MKYIKKENTTKNNETEIEPKNEKTSSILKKDQVRFKSKIIKSEKFDKLDEELTNDNDDNENNKVNKDNKGITDISNKANNYSFKHTQLGNDLNTSTEHHSIKKDIKVSFLSSYFTVTMEQIKHFFHKYKKNVRVFYSTLSIILSIVIAFIMTFSFVQNKNLTNLNNSSIELAKYQNILTNENMKYFKEILQNPSIFTILDSKRCLENELFTYKVIVSYANNKTTYSTIDDQTKSLSINVNSGNVATIEFVETYSKIAKNLLDNETLKLYSLFVSPILDENNDWALRDYRTFLTIGDSQYYKFSEDGSDTPNYSVTTAITNTSNTYTIHLNNFLEQADGYLPYIYFETNNDTSNNLDYKKGIYRELTTNANLLPINANFPLSLADDTLSETEQILQLLNSYAVDNNITVDDLKDYFTATPTKGYFEKLLNMVIEKSDSFKSILNIVGDEEVFYLEGLKTNTLKKLGNTANTNIDNIIDNLIALPNLSDVESIISQYQANPSTINDEQKGKIITYQALELIYKTFNLQYALTPDEKETAQEIKAIDVTNYEELSTTQIELIDKLLNLYSSENIYNISLTFYKLKSLIKSFDFDSKINLSQLIVRRQATEN